MQNAKNSNRCKAAVLIASIWIGLNCYLPASFAEDGRIYKTIHEDGTVSYSDQASPEAVEVTLNVNTNTMQSTSAKLKIAPQINQKKREYQLNILNPQADATIRNNIGKINIAASLQPTLAGFYQLNINEQTVDSATGVFILENMHRGTYQYQIKFIDNSGKVIASSETRSLHLHKASALIN